MTSVLAPLPVPSRRLKMVGDVAKARIGSHVPANDDPLYRAGRRRSVVNENQADHSIGLLNDLNAGDVRLDYGYRLDDGLPPSELPHLHCRTTLVGSSPPQGSAQVELTTRGGAMARVSHGENLSSSKALAQPGVQPQLVALPPDGFFPAPIEPFP